jgi:hypothetical protein
MSSPAFAEKSPSLLGVPLFWGYIYTYIYIYLFMDLLGFTAMGLNGT